MIYIVVEIQSNGETAAVIQNSYSDRSEAENKYHTVLAYAATSDVPTHSAVMLSDEGYFVKSEKYIHKTEAVE